jgi:hypothetical protein
MSINIPRANELYLAPELAILATLEASLAATIQVLAALHPDLGDVAPADYAGDVAVAARLCRRATGLIATINKYRLAVRNF